MDRRRGPEHVPILDSLPFAPLFALALVACEEDFVEPNAFVRDAARSDAAPATQDADAGADLDATQDRFAIAPDGSGPLDPECNLNGRWLVAQRVLASALGQDQASHNWFYLEVAQSGAALAIVKGLHCGYEVVPTTSLGAAVDSSGAWAAFLKNDSDAGRAGSFAKEGTSCHLTLEKRYTIRGATVAYYSDPSHPMPTASDAASGNTPGWEDWDGDSNPGISLKVNSPLAKGTLYVAQRDYTIYDGTTAQQADKFKVSISYDSEQAVLGRSAGSSSAIETMSSPSSDPTQHYAWFHALAAGQATGTDEQICAAVRMLKDTLVPEANQ